ncbi:hypothetical protein EDEG_04050 [Edhazardia aedis USNM 41457]|uniref:Uncharacterized protein n=1 Tax=Edhazardia aedis (strain USNM 41457) TaxID=1003232 RepID=J9DF54_EDHAE|nr:hypothetical protein EDEG_04050 [Edhazardia aedis USNM 41457]|eukprot:EJW01230.1 hypothetical protein EDEG_04050 [Edhazardia aedis USNM 41457]
MKRDCDSVSDIGSINKSGLLKNYCIQRHLLNCLNENLFVNSTVCIKCYKTIDVLQSNRKTRKLAKKQSNKNFRILIYDKNYIIFTEQYYIKFLLQLFLFLSLSCIFVVL